MRQQEVRVCVCVCARVVLMRAYILCANVRVWMQVLLAAPATHHIPGAPYPRRARGEVDRARDEAFGTNGYAFSVCV
jgi:hypothetical protein